MTDDEVKKVQEILERSEHPTHMWNAVYSKDDRKFLLGLVRRQEEEIVRLKALDAVYDGLSRQIANAEDNRILVQVVDAPKVGE